VVGTLSVRRALYTSATPVEHVGIDHGGLHALVPEQLLYRPDVVAIHQQVRGERVSQGVTGCRLGDTQRCRLFEA